MLRNEHTAVRAFDEHLARTRDDRFEVSGRDREEGVRVPTGRHLSVDLLERQIGIGREQCLDPPPNLTTPIEDARATLGSDYRPSRHDEVEPIGAKDRVFRARGYVR